MIKNTILTPERSYKRKIQELWLSAWLNVRFSKEKILELYLNKISFGSNSDGVEKASRRFFNASASDLNVLEASVLGSLPQAPTTYNPFRKRDSLMGYVYMFDATDTSTQQPVRRTSEDPFLKGAYDKMKTLLDGITYKSRGRDNVKICGVTQQNLKVEYSINDACLVIEKDAVFDFWNHLQIEHVAWDEEPAEWQDGSVPQEPSTYYVEYQTGRKDRVLMRMFEDNYIDGEELKEAFIWGLTYAFHSSAESIKYPHFVFYVREYLENRYGEEFFQQWGWQIYTTIDPTLQERAEEIVKTQADVNATKFGINNAALVTLDNSNREILSMVGSIDFNDKDIDGEVNITTSLKQPGSSFKPLIFARAFETNSLSPDTPIFDVETKFGSYEPENYDGEFLGPMTIAESLAHSRNITAVKMYYLATAASWHNDDPEYDLIEFLRNLGLKSLNHRNDGFKYGAPIALGTGEITPLEFSEVYASFANNGIHQEATPILKIVDHEWNEISPIRSEKQTLLPGAAYLITKILSGAAYRPPYWTTFLSVPGQPAAAKTGTSNKRFGNDIFPRDLWTVGYTPLYTTVVWTGNTDGTAANNKANGLEASGPIWHQFMKHLHEDKEEVSFSRPSSVLGSGDFLYIKWKKPQEVDAIKVETIEIDGLCEGKVTELTPASAIKQGYFLEMALPLEKRYATWKNPVLEWIDTEEGRKYLYEEYELPEDQIRYLESPENACERPNPNAPKVTTSLSDGLQLFPGIYPVEVSFQSDYPIRSIEIYVNEAFYRSINVNDKTSGTYSGEFGLASTDGNKQQVIIKVVDKYGYSSSKIYDIQLLIRDTTPPVITLSTTNKIAVEIWAPVQISGTVSDVNDITKIEVYLNSDLYGSFSDAKSFEISLDSSRELGLGDHELIVVAEDFQGNAGYKRITISVK